MTNYPKIWRPYTQHQTMGDLTQIESASGAILRTSDGREIVDLISSWWVNVHGHAHPVIAEAIGAQAKRLEQVIFAGFTHEPAEQLANGLLAVMGAPFEHLFLSDNGSTSVEVAIKMALQFAANTGHPERNKIIAFDGGFHGDTWAAMAAGRKSGFFEAYARFLPLDVIHLDFAATFEGDPDQAANEARTLESLKQVISKSGSEIAGLIIEPLIQGASGMRMCSASWLNQVVSLAQDAGIKVIFDEVMTGFGRTGRMFAFEHLEARPDLVCLSKGITGGFMPLAATATTREIFAAFLDSSYSSALSHGHSFSGNPLACSAAVASLGLFEEEQTLARIAAQTEIHQERMPRLANTQQHRFCGAIAACELKGPDGYASQQSVELRNRFLAADILIRPLGNTLYLFPPACLAPEELHKAYDKIEPVLAAI